MHQIFSLFPRSPPPSPSFQSDVGTEDRGSEGEGEQPKRKREDRGNEAQQ